MYGLLRRSTPPAQVSRSLTSSVFHRHSCLARSLPSALVSRSLAAADSECLACCRRRQPHSAQRLYRHRARDVGEQEVLLLPYHAAPLKLGDERADVTLALALALARSPASSPSPAANCTQRQPLAAPSSPLTRRALIKKNLPALVYNCINQSLT
jgi:hypothetical protein